MADELGLPRTTVQKSIKEAMPKDMRIAGDASELLVQCCNQFVHLVSTQANDISDREKRTTISPEYVIKALEELEFGEQYLEAVKAAWEEWKTDNKEHREQKAGSKKGDSGLTQEQLIELQQKLFEEARAATLSGPLPSLAVEAAAGSFDLQQPAQLEGLPDLLDTLPQEQLQGQQEQQLAGALSPPGELAEEEEEGEEREPMQG